MIIIRFYTLIFITFFCFGINVIGQDLVTDRPDQTESSVTVPKGSLQIESGFLLGFSEEDNFISRELVTPSTLFRFGLLKGLELRFVNQYERVKTNLDTIHGFNDLEFGTKIQVLGKENQALKHL